MTIETPYGGSVPYNKLEQYPTLKRIWAGYAFSVDYNEERGHYYALIDQKNTERKEVAKQPGACANCHAAEAPQLIEQMGWEKFNSTPYNEIQGTLHLGSSCADCHDPETMALRITRPAFKNAMDERGIDLSKATRQEMRTYVCAQCHVEYYFEGDNKLLTFPWSKGLQIDNIEEYYDAYGFKDWTHKETDAPMLKMQHPEFEMFSTGMHARSGVACADCHMPYVREGAVKVSDHWLRSPLTNVNNACQTCHKQDEQELKERVATIQNNTAGLLRSAEDALVDAIDAIMAAMAAGATDEQLTEARDLHRKASMRWDFVAVGEQHRLPQPAGSGAHPGQRDRLRPPGADRRGTGDPSEPTNDAMPRSGTERHHAGRSSDRLSISITCHVFPSSSSFLLFSPARTILATNSRAIQPEAATMAFPDPAASCVTRPPSRAGTASAISARAPMTSSPGWPPPSSSSGRCCRLAPPAMATRPINAFRRSPATPC